MKKYDPQKNQDPKKWLSISEQERIDLVQQYHENSGELTPENGWDAHSVIHCVIENQIAIDEEIVRETVDRLLDQGLSRHDTIHALGAVMTEGIYVTLKNKSPFDAESYRRRLKMLTAKRWLKNKW